MRLVSSFSPLWPEKMLDMISVFFNLLRLVLCPVTWSIFRDVPCAFEENVFFFFGMKGLYIYQLSPFDLGYCPVLKYC